MKHWGYNLDDSHENEGNPATPDSSVGERKDCSNSSGDDNKTISTEPSDCAPEDEDSSCSSSDYLFLEDSLLAKLEIPLTTDEQNLIGKFCKKIENTITENKQKPEESILKSIEETVNNHLNTGARLNSLCCNECKSTVTNLILEKIGDVLDDRVKPRDETREYRGGVNDITNQDDEDKDEALDIIGSIIRNLLLKGGKAKEEFFYTDTELANNCGFDCANLSKECVEIKNKLKSIAYEGIVNKNEHAQKGEPEEVDIDNIYFYIKYPQDSIIEPVKIFNKAEDLKDKALNLKVGILKIGKSEVRVKSVDGKRNYTNISGSIEMSFTTEAGEISIYLHREKDSNKIEVEIDDESKAKLNKLKAEKKSLGENCLLGGKSVLKAIEDKGFEKNGSVSTETTKDDLSTNLTQVRLQQNREVALGG
ncbi:hypothetical protein [Wolbachia endosymbiont (group A) of Myopa testacea]|uniref:hypothetical protein n=1 Tax=Wolbachia endosymbiont (group A) of Myopa testacea TaxID=3066148 RepID=UPI003341BB87